MDQPLMKWLFSFFHTPPPTPIPALRTGLCSSSLVCTNINPEPAKKVWTRETFNEKQKQDFTERDLPHGAPEQFPRSWPISLRSLVTVHREGGGGGVWHFISGSAHSILLQGSPRVCLTNGMLRHPCEASGTPWGEGSCWREKTGLSSLATAKLQVQPDFEPDSWGLDGIFLEMKLQKWLLIKHNATGQSNSEAQFLSSNFSFVLSSCQNLWAY